MLLPVLLNIDIGIGICNITLVSIYKTNWVVTEWLDTKPNSLIAMVAHQESSLVLDSCLVIFVRIDML